MRNIQFNWDIFCLKNIKNDKFYTIEIVNKKYLSNLDLIDLENIFVDFGFRYSDLTDKYLSLTCFEIDLPLFLLSINNNNFIIRHTGLIPNIFKTELFDLSKINTI